MNHAGCTPHPINKLVITGFLLIYFRVFDALLSTVVHSSYSVVDRSDFAVASCIRVLLAWMHQCPEATIAFVEDKSVFLFTIQSAGSAEDSLHVQGLGALLIGVSFFPRCILSIASAFVSCLFGLFFSLAGSPLFSEADVSL